MSDAGVEYERDDWTQDGNSDAALRSATLGDTGPLPARSVALYARWWQLETWLRELTYVEMRSLRGAAWADSARAATGRQRQDAAFRHMAGADNENPLAYLDYSQLINVIDAHWEYLGYALLHREVWAGRQAELSRIRHRIGHLRRAHPDDLNRLEQTLRDLEQGAFRALSSYNSRWTPDHIEENDQVATGWILGEHETAQRLVAHADRQYDTRIIVRKSRRPWGGENHGLPNGSGDLWHADFYFGSRVLNAPALWRDSSMLSVKPLLVHFLADSPGSCSFTFSAIDDSVAVAEAIGNAFEAVLHNCRPGFVEEGQMHSWAMRVQGIHDYRVLTGTGWNIVDSDTVPISIFGAGGGTSSPW